MNKEYKPDRETEKNITFEITKPVFSYIIDINLRLLHLWSPSQSRSFRSFGSRMILWRFIIIQRDLVVISKLLLLDSCCGTISIISRGIFICIIFCKHLQRKYILIFIIAYWSFSEFLAFLIRQINRSRSDDVFDWKYLEIDLFHLFMYICLLKQCSYLNTR